MYTGPKAPMVQRVKRVWDPNLKRVMCVEEPPERESRPARTMGAAASLLVAIISAVILLSAGDLRAWEREEWDKTDKILLGVYGGALVADCGQTMDVLGSADYYERNPIVRWADNQAGDAGVLLYFAGCFFGSRYIADRLPPNGRKIFLGIASGLQIKVVHNNYSLGVRWRIGGGS